MSAAVALRPMLKPRCGLEYDAYAWPGGYPIVYVACSAFDGRPSSASELSAYVLCPACASKAYRESLLLALYGDDGEYFPEDFVTVDFIHYEGPPEICERCDAETESAYGDPETETG